MRLLSNIVPAFVNVLAFARNLVRSQGALAAEDLFLRKQLTFFVEREQTPRHTNNVTRFTMAALARLFDWKNALVVVKPDTLVRWHRKGFRLFWRWKSRHKGRPPVPEELKKLIVEMAVTNVSWGEERITHELLVKLGIRVSPRTVGKYMPSRDDSDRDASHSSQCWSTFVRNHAKAIIATDFLTVVTARFQFPWCPKIQTNSRPASQAGRNGWSGGRLCSGPPIAEPRPRRLVSANFENTSRIPAFGSVRVFGHECVQRRLAGSVGESPTGEKVSAP